jgi:hypothetical protein
VPSDTRRIKQIDIQSQEELMRDSKLCHFYGGKGDINRKISVGAIRPKSALL